MYFDRIFEYIYGLAPAFLILAFVAILLIYYKFIRKKSEKVLFIFVVISGLIMLGLGFLTYVRIFFQFNNIGW